MRLRKVNGHWESAIIVSSALNERFPKGAVIERLVSKNFPTQELNDTEWQDIEKLPKAF
jgi:hypothetical protein